MENDSDQELIGELPQSIIEIILTKLPIRDAVRRSIPSRDWSFKWASLMHLVFNDRCATHDNNRSIVETNLLNFMTRFLFLRNGPIHKFSLSTSYLQGAPDVDQWLLFISWKEIKELILELGGEWCGAPSCLFSCKKLTVLELVRCEPSLTLLYFDGFELTVHAPEVKYLILEGEFNYICLANTPNLAAISGAMTEVSAEHFESSSGCNLNKFLGGVSRFQRLTWHIYFTEYMSIGNGRGWNPLNYHHLKFIELYQVSFVDDKEVYLVLQLIENSPNLLELQIFVFSTLLAAKRDCDLGFWARKLSSDFKFHRLKTVKMIGVFNGHVN